MKDIQLQEAHRIPDSQERPEKKLTWHNIVKTLNIENKEKILKVAREKNVSHIQRKPHQKTIISRRNPEEPGTIHSAIKAYDWPPRLLDLEKSYSGWRKKNFP